MSNFQKTSTSTSSYCIDLECGGGGGGVNECFSDAEEEGSSCYSHQFYSTHEGEEEGEGGGDEIDRLSDCSVILPYNNGDGEGKVVIINLANRDCRICHLSLVVKDDDDDDAIELGCCCKNDLAAAHRHCALTWFKIKGNKICEICNSTVSNLVVPNETPLTHGTMEVDPAATSVATTRMSTGGRGGGRGTEGGGCINGHRLLNFILACLVFAFVISWLFHFNIPS